jgi:CHASE3 domain sensor protein
MGILVFSHFNSLKNYNNQAVHTYTVISQITQAESLLKDAENGTRAFLITKNSVFLRPVLNTNRLLMPALDSLKVLVHDNLMQTKDCENAVNLAMLQLTLSDSLINASNTGGEETDSIVNALMLRSRDAMQQYRTVTKHMINIETDQLIYRKKQIGYYQSKLLNNFTVLFVAVMLIIVILGAWAVIEFKKRVRFARRKYYHA